MEYKDYYKILGVTRKATDDEIKRAYRKLARKYHPDVSKEKDADTRFKEANEAYEVLKDPKKRAAYDQIDPSRPHAGQGFQQPPHGNSGAGFRRAGPADDASANFSDFFESMFGQGFGGMGGGPRATRRQAGVKGQDHVSRVEIDLEDAFTGGTRTIRLRAPTLDDRGRTVERERSLKVRIPQGARTGQRLRLSGQGTPGQHGGPAGDLYLEIALRPHPYFKVDGADLVLELPVAPWEAALGATVKAPTPAGAVDLRIPPNSNAGKRLRLKGRGMPGKTPGNLYVSLVITLPPTGEGEASEKERALYERMAQEMAFNPRARLGV